MLFNPCCSVQPYPLSSYNHHYLYATATLTKVTWLYLTALSDGLCLVVTRSISGLEVHLWLARNHGIDLARYQRWDWQQTRPIRCNSTHSSSMQSLSVRLYIHLSLFIDFLQVQGNYAHCSSHRKIKCSGDRPACVKCSWSKRPCIYGPYPETSPRATQNTQGSLQETHGSHTEGGETMESESDLRQRVNLIEVQLAMLTQHVMNNPTFVRLDPS